jgi:uncharacterized membrane protein (DUF373 family)
MNKTARKMFRFIIYILMLFAPFGLFVATNKLIRTQYQAYYKDKVMEWVK